LLEPIAALRCKGGEMRDRPFTKVGVIVGLAAITALLVGCGGNGDPGGMAAETVGPDETRTTVYFLTDGGAAPIGVRRTIRADSPYLVHALRALFEGPTPSERDEGLTTAIPAGVKIIDYESKGFGGTGAVLNLDGLPIDSNVFQRIRIITQIVRTTLGVSGKERVWIQSDGEPWATIDHEGEVRKAPYEYRSLFGWTRVCEAKPGTEATPGRCFSALP
jgi:hypothetical protein